MTLPRLGFVVARLYVAVFTLLTATYCLLAYIPFTYHQVHLGGLLPWLTAFSKYHPYLYWPAFVGAALTLPNRRDPSTRPLTLLFLFFYGLFGLRLAFYPLLATLDNDIQSVVWCVLALTPLVWMAAIDWLAERNDLAWAPIEGAETNRIFRACWLSAAYVWLLSAAIFAVRSGFVAKFGAGRWAMVLVWSLFSHGAVFMALFLLLNFTGTVASLVSKRPAVHILFYAGTAVAVGLLILKFVVFAPLSFTGHLAIVVAFAMAFSMVAFIVGISLRLYRGGPGAVEGPLVLLCGPIPFLRSVSRPARILVLLAGSAIASGVLLKASRLDWEYLVQTLVILSLWAAVLAFFYVTTPPSTGRGDSLVIAASAFLCVYMGLIALQPHWHIPRGGTAPEFEAVLDEYGNYDVGFRFARGVLAPPLAVTSDGSLYEFLASNTNIPRSVRTVPVDINLAGNIAPTNGPKPHIFIFVIDSLRRDYLSPYNSAVTFTPGIKAFAGESIVAQNAFTRYSGTGLSEPSIWAGGMLLHKQYVTPFFPMNALQKLLQVEQYQQFISKDEILSAILAPSAWITELDAGRPTMDCEFCRTLFELQNKIGATKTGEHSIFAYTQPQNIHVSVIDRQGRSVPPGEEYPGFDAAYASRVRAVDTCFGQFIQFLKTTGIYDDSIVILTSDHGDSLGERGRWGHAYNLVPEVVRIPLLVHLPTTMQTLVFDQRSPAFLVDITPSLYYVLGHRPVERNQIFGRPLFTTTSQESTRYARDSYLIASSYAPVYGILGSGGHSLYVADGVAYKDYLYEWAGESPVVSSPVTLQIRTKRQQMIRDYVGEISGFYGFRGAHGAPKN